MKPPRKSKGRGGRPRVDEAEARKGSDLGKGYTWNSLQKKGLHHEIGKSTGDELGRGQEKERGLGPGYTAGRAGDHGNARGLAQQTGNDEAAKQRRIDENCARLRALVHIKDLHIISNEL